ncbi:Mannan-binding lectin serine protease 1 [Larimichthys crocea]|uniref:Uncharacterized protein n=1 Tax=Larimichthys crocea TaxID=215358 RepID=A0ACD3QX76_LARCR|nr:Mannan-binding lectin serine protease 1 [Larimichthys crocea]
MLAEGREPYYLKGIVSWGPPCEDRQFKVSECWHLPDSEPPMHGHIQSPQYPQPYPPNLQEQWDLSVPEGYHIRLTFTHLDIEASAGCHYDALTVLYDGKALGKFCGHENSADGNHPGNQPILSPGNTLTLLFQTDKSNPERHQNVGFSAEYQAIDIDECSAPETEDGPLCSQICLNTVGSYLCSCHHGFELRSDQRTCVLSCTGGIFEEPEGHLSSPGYPNPPPHAVTCQYIISVEFGFTLSLNFTDNFHIESLDTAEGLNCPYHWLKVAKGRVTPVLSEYLYRDHIFVRCDQGYKLMTNGKEIKSFSAVCQSSGQWHLPLPECHMSECWQLPYTEPEIRGEVQSPQYPQPYLPNLLKQWHLWVPKGYKIRLSLTHLDIKASAGCYEDSLMVLEDQKILGKFCGQENSTDHPGKELIHSQSNRLTLIFQTNDSTAEPQQHTGFFATYKAIDIDECLKVDSADGSGPLCSQICVNSPGSYHCSCHNGYKIHLDQRTCLFSCSGHIFTKHEGHLSSPKYPGPSPPFLVCKYIISVEPRFTVTLNFTDKFHIMSVDTEQGPRIVSGFGIMNIYPPRMTKKLMYADLPVVEQETCLNSVNKTVRLKLQSHSDKPTADMGWSYCVLWSLYLSTSECWQLPDTEPVIHGEVQSPQYPQPYYPNLLKQWHLWVPKGYQIQLSLTHLDIKASAGCYEDSLTVRATLKPHIITNNRTVFLYSRPETTFDSNICLFTLTRVLMTCTNRGLESSPRTIAFFINYR